jgi:energy-coupling factor transporter ATP-binding protein EcfA2
MSTLVYVHGTNGSGKSTLARAVLAAAGGAQSVAKLADSPKATYTYTDAPWVVLAGKYGTACGGVDGIQPYADLHRVLEAQARHDRSVFAEGLVTPGQDTCVKFASYFTDAVFILLDTPDTVCIRNVLARRAAKGTTKTYDPKNLYKKQQSARNWATRLERAGLVVERLHYRQARIRVLALLGLPEPSVEQLLY